MVAANNFDIKGWLDVIGKMVVNIVKEKSPEDLQCEELAFPKKRKPEYEDIPSGVKKTWNVVPDNLTL